MSTEETIQPSSRNGNKEAALFTIPAREPKEPALGGRPRLRRAERHQVVMQVACLDPPQAGCRKTIGRV